MSTRSQRVIPKPHTLSVPTLNCEFFWNAPFQALRTFACNETSVPVAPVLFACFGRMNAKGHEKSRPKAAFYLWRKRMDSDLEVDQQTGTKKPPEGGSLSWRKRKFPYMQSTRLAGFFYAYFRLECPGFLTRYKARFIADSETSYTCASDRMVYSPVW